HFPDPAVEVEIVFCGKPFVDAGMFEEGTGSGPDFIGIPDRIESENIRLACGGFKQAQQHSNCRSFARSVGPEESKDDARWDFNREAIYGPRRLEVPGQCMSANNGIAVFH